MLAASACVSLVLQSCAASAEGCAICPPRLRHHVQRVLRASTGGTRMCLHAAVVSSIMRSEMRGERCALLSPRVLWEAHTCVCLVSANMCEECNALLRAAHVCLRLVSATICVELYYVWRARRASASGIHIRPSRLRHHVRRALCASVGGTHMFQLVSTITCGERCAHLRAAHALVTASSLQLTMCEERCAFLRVAH